MGAVSAFDFTTNFAVRPWKQARRRRFFRKKIFVKSLVSLSNL